MNTSRQRAFSDSAAKGKHAAIRHRNGTTNLVFQKNSKSFAFADTKCYFDNIADVSATSNAKLVCHRGTRALLLKNPNQLENQQDNKWSQKYRNLEKSKTTGLTMIRGNSTTRCKQKTRLIEVYGGSHVGRKSFLHLLHTLQISSENDERCGHRYRELIAETRMVFTAANMCQEKTTKEVEVDACIVMFAVSDRASFQFAKLCVQNIRRSHREDIPVFLVANKSDMIRYRKVSSNDAIRVAELHKCQYHETSLTLNHTVQELLKDVLTQIEKAELNSRPRCLRRVAESFQSIMKKWHAILKLH